MSEVGYTVVEHDGGWAYSVDGAFSETFPTHEAAHRAAEAAARRQERPDDDDRVISFEDGRGRQHEEVARGSDRPHTHVDD